ncbi:hypothetical protein [Paracerasibacillus soli]|uniref:Helix-turn-helix domain-containing protein n=1 Tax=Paracerasibacillus soli TaxID=480284 RepID=A0ABU5CTX3_9BACI|nr:hypothetical protein [Virgibacillus soli]MDY0409822.1 hypothetical protein [Virgibacillus soli]
MIKDMDKEMYPRYELSKLLNITYSTKLVKILNEYNINPISKDTRNIEYYKKSDTEKLLKIQSELYEYYQTNFVTYNEGIRLGVSAHSLSLSNPTELPIIARVKKYCNIRTVYEKRLVNVALERKALLNNTSYYTRREVSLLFKVVCIERFLKSNNVEPIIINSKSGSYNRWDKNEIDSLFKRREKLYNYYDQNHLTYKEVSKLLNVKMVSSYTIKSNGLILDELPSLAKFNRFKKTKVAFRKSSIDKYLKAKKEKGEKRQEAKGKKKYLNLKESKSKRKDFILKKGKSGCQFIEEGNLKNKHLLLRDISKVLGLSKELVVLALQENEITPRHVISNVKWYSKDEIYKLKEAQNSLLTKFENEYMTFIELRSLNISGNSIQKFTARDLPRLIKIGKFKNSKVVYPKNSVDEYMSQMRREQLQKEITKDIALPYATYERLIVALEISFSANAPLTQKYWFSYVQQILNKTKGNKQSVKKQIIRFASITKLIANITKSKEIFSYSVKELNLLLFNHEIFPGVSDDPFFIL